MMKMRIVVGLVVTALSACGGGSLGNSGTAGSSGGTPGTGAAGTTGTGGTAWIDTAGTTGTGGTAGIDTAGTTGTAGTAGIDTAGTTGTAGTGGAGGTGGTGVVPACGDTISGASDVVEAAITRSSDNTLVTAAVNGAVTVSGIASCASVTCMSQVTTAAATRFALAGGTQGEGWMLYLRNTAMPPDTIKVGDTFDLTVDAGVDSSAMYTTVNQTIVLTRNGNVMLFAANLQRYGYASGAVTGVPVPRLEAFSIAVTDAGALCDNPRVLGCIPRRHAARVAMGSDASIVLAGGQTGRIGDLSVTNGTFMEMADYANCDSKSYMLMAAFRLP